MRHAGVYATTARAAKFAQCTYCKQRDFCGLFDKSRSDKAAPVRSDSYVHGQLGQAYSEKTILLRMDDYKRGPNTGRAHPSSDDCGRGGGAGRG
ncbi:uncharacterized protein LOC119191617 isoform X3 [Manduca sexta]|uniref:uncharacterized protein LOC119190071 isoform X4 n=1 Tax=Manduca sexta TaxID=7130 RepID=UPI0018908F56|nr:uncharacterized protein LOC119190071 isoform X4 [Manduca sexta]XP_037301401.1 uncharacterized protein LOC119191617 isoform X3 [Manduca sexta]